jgi:hypothetical protein
MFLDPYIFFGRKLDLCRTSGGKTAVSFVGSWRVGLQPDVRFERVGPSSLVDRRLDLGARRQYRSLDAGEWDRSLVMIWRTLLQVWWAFSESAQAKICCSEHWSGHRPDAHPSVRCILGRLRLRQIVPEGPGWKVNTSSSPSKHEPISCTCRRLD